MSEPVILTFSDDVVEIFDKVDSILYTSGWGSMPIGTKDVPDETKLLIHLLQERALVIAEAGYLPKDDFTDAFKQKAQQMCVRLRKRELGSVIWNAIDLFSKYESDYTQTDCNALYYPEINAYIRCGDLAPDKLFELLQKDNCLRVIVFPNQYYQQPEGTEEVFHAFEMRAPKSYIMERLKAMEDERLQCMHDVWKMHSESILPVINEETE